MKSRLLKVVIAEENNCDNQITPFSDAMTIPPFGIIFRGAEEKVDNDNITKTHYRPNISREFEFEKNIDNPEWMLKK